ncbi:DUF3888 domain-containing protein [Sutcliffiella halmapala]|uniref:DUF3888 domain-containing protein n=1 Tax=Sutcliffiella halmapala TaxID=79882 RepID=UPI0009955DC4|nr:DUF3888 domain-containing protein [Sutcliffiella halmapala]
MRKIRSYIIIFTAFLIAFNLSLSQTKANNVELDKENCEKIRYALIVSLGPIIFEAMEEIYKDKPGGKRQWAPWDTKILKVEQLYGEGGSYNVTVEVHTYVGAHNSPNGTDTIKIEVNAWGSKLLEYEHRDS